MEELYKIGITNEIIEENFKKWFGDDFVLKVKQRYQHTIGKTKVDIVFTKDNKALWITKYKGEYYGNAVDGVKKGDGFVYIDIFTTFIENAKKTLKEV